MKIFDDYKKHLKLIEVEEILDLLFYRPLAFLFVKSIIKTNITPNQLTLTATFIGLFGALMYLFNSASSIFAAGILLIIYDVLDCGDGQLARIKKNGTMTGRILDGFADYIVTTSVYLGIGFGFASNSSNPIFYWLLVISAGISNAAHSVLLDFYRNRFLDYALSRNSILGDELKIYYDELEKLKEQNGSYFERLVIWTYIKYSSLQLKFSSSTVENERKKYDKQNFYDNNKTIMRLWTFVGPTTELSFLIICSFFNRLDIYLVGIVTVGNFIAILFYLIQRNINNSTLLNEKL